MLTHFGISSYFNTPPTSKHSTGPESLSLRGTLSWASSISPGDILFRPQAYRLSAPHPSPLPTHTPLHNRRPLLVSQLWASSPPPTGPMRLCPPLPLPQLNSFLQFFSSRPSVPAPALCLALTHTPEPRRPPPRAGLPCKNMPLPKPPFLSHGRPAPASPAPGTSIKSGLKSGRTSSQSS